MASARARRGAAVSAARALTLRPAFTAPASAAVPSDTGTSTSTETSVSTTTLSASSLSSSTTAVTTAPTATYSLPASRTGRVTLSAAAKADPVVRGKAAVATAMRFKGISYRAGGTSPSTGFDCSGYTRYVYSQLGIRIPRVSRDQYASMRHISIRVAVPGDLIFFHNSSGRVYHVAIYAGHGYVWHSPHTGTVVKLEKIWTSAYYVGRLKV